jgi:hypothetical protein
MFGEGGCSGWILGLLANKECIVISDHNTPMKKLTVTSLSSFFIIIFTDTEYSLAS